ncbi:hypothetical protein ENUP19_0084G0017 [Entamoeba nuttalli]|uniref:Zinc finger protein containing CCHC type domain containing protein n=2 Tax=Entamoeba nuttalli TaxID=412467 RepID=K2HBT2_ENTNP|nr:zinc finger protein containing CCHC type domain containing protein [Entamoeba nuttalli P19]EKE40104.1 zinc finger protein containing CCHC type domain containing protein [Entamoeba nuttalli P19]|eukprot:XP_008857558.1 zinc finger protein containing CCHC type domain containing protein [Entamoeba nuttalli P19]
MSEHKSHYNHDKDKICFYCRQPGHCLKNCPKKAKGEDSICYNCGSHDHILRDCPEPRTGKLAFSTCFVCHQMGHISRDCPNNPKGIYPQGGGCRYCGDVNHFAKDCPNKRKKQTGDDDQDDYVSKRDIEEKGFKSGDGDEEKPIKLTKSEQDEVPKKKKKVIKF